MKTLLLFLMSVSTPAAMIFAHIKGLYLEGIRTAWAGGAETPERQAIYGDRLEDVLISGFQGAASIPGTRAILIENSRGVLQ